MIDSGDDNLHFVLGDVSGKGVAASMLMANLQAMFRTLISTKLPLDRCWSEPTCLCDSTLPTHYANLAAVARVAAERLNLQPEHPPPCWSIRGRCKTEATGLPVEILQ